jgi:hypothetical protein
MVGGDRRTALTRNTVCVWHRHRCRMHTIVQQPSGSPARLHPGWHSGQVTTTQERLVGITEGRPVWAAAAFDALLEVAATYRGLIVYSDLAEQVQAGTGLRTRAYPRNWIGSVLADVVHRCHREGLPPLTALVVHKDDGQVGAGYDEVLRVSGYAPIDDQLARERHAAESRLLCYRTWAADVPAGAAAALSPQLEAKVRRRRPRAHERLAQLCPSCFVEVPASGICDSCT